MHYLLSASSRPVLEQLARGRTLCGFDFDGTLAPIVEHPDHAGMRASTHHLLARLAALYPCVVVSGRARTDLADKLAGVPVGSFIGSHGAETEGLQPAIRPQVQNWKAILETELAGAAGVWLEDKGLSLAVHYRQSENKAEVRRLISRAAKGLKQARVFGGKSVVNVVMNGDPHKGVALAAERDRLGCERVLYVGDDQNDEDAFAMGGELVSVRVGRKLQSLARYYLRSQGEIDTLLERLIALREEGERRD